MSNYTEVIWKIDLHNFFHVVNLRAESHAQQEIQDYANAMYYLVEPHFPLCCEAFEDYIRNAVTFSKQEMEVIKYELADKKVFALEGLSKRERTEFLEKLE